MTDKIKNSGEIFTPEYLVKDMLDFVGYTDNIAKRHIIDNSCGDGAFLVEIVKRYCEKVSDKKQLKNDLEKFIHGIEIDKGNVDRCVDKLNKIVKKYGLENVFWDVKNANALEIYDYDKKMDFVVGNPPYVRVHNLKENHKTVKSFSFSDKGMTDLYITFYEIGFNMLNENGRLCLITPSSFLSSKSGQNLREYINSNRNLVKVIDIGHFQPFENATTYTFITMFDKSIKTDFVRYFVYDGDKKHPVFIDELSYEDFYADGRMFFSKKDDLRFLNEVNNRSMGMQSKSIEVKNGFATLADTIFIGNIEINDNLVIKTIKASTGKWTKSIFPYDKNSRPLSENEIKKEHKEIYDYLFEKKDALVSRSIVNKEEWYLFGRAQAINDVYKDKITINTMVKDVNSIKLNEVPAGCGVYSGLYILTEYDMSTIKEILLNNEFINYVRLLKKYKSGGYYTFSSNDLKKFLLYSLASRNKNINRKEKIYEQQSIFGHNKQLVPVLSQNRG